MYEKVYKLGITENHLRVLGFFTRGFDRSSYIREIRREMGISPRTAQLVLEALEKKGVLESETKGKIRVYRIRKNETAKNYLILVEEYKKIVFLESNPLIREIIEKTKPCMKGIVLVFGSYPKGTAKKDSDLDMFVAGEYDRAEVKSISKKYGVKINVKRYPRNQFIKGLKTDHLIKEILLNHVVISGIEEFIEIVMKYG